MSICLPLVRVRQAAGGTPAKSGPRPSAIVAAIGDYVGGMQGRQSIMQNLAEVNKAQAALVASQTAFNNSKVIEKMDEPLMIESWLLIKQNVMSGY